MPIGEAATTLPAHEDCPPPKSGADPGPRRFSRGGRSGRARREMAHGGRNPSPKRGALPPGEGAVASRPHPLEHSWTFWFDSPGTKSSQAAWGSSIRPVYTFSTIEEFWSVYNNLHQPSKLVVGADLHCFKNKVEPKWEDPVCANGGKWTVTFSRGRSDTSWLYTLLAMVGEQFDHGEEICGAVVSVRAKQDKIALWTRNASDEAAQMSIGKQWKEFLDCSQNAGFIFHEDAKKLDRAAKNRYTA
ncbi:eukaryotic translation initiation factor 4E-2-like [Syzygium oleosum]|uniref:eukaryotic translation initiation factor 4E-2-like n=1 Tax=Syzygium oleosum TaxID=219896 RepID=UPI0024BAC2DD|nr:eukaryotic translation initiation factor 4E-2-like [Syzygium oleosum]